MELRCCGYDYYDSHHLPIKRIKTNEINNYFDNNFGLDRIILLS